MSHIKFSHPPPGFSRLPLATLLLALAFASAARAQHQHHNMPMPTNSSSPAAGMAANAQESHGVKNGVRSARRLAGRIRHAC